MRIDILTLFPEMFTPLTESIIGRAVKSGKVEIVVTDIREYTENKHKKCDDYPFGGGAGMVMTPQPIYSAINAVDPNHEARRIFMSPKGRTFCQPMVKELLSYQRILLLCGHYEGVDQRVLDLCIDEEISLGDFVLTGGEIPAMAITDSICRYIGGVISDESLSEESFTGNLLEYPQFTRPQVFMGMQVPEVLVSGNHKEVDKWRRNEALKLTKKLRPDLIDDKSL
ncbi:MAG: tRNA (guanosine(37)-N1)-methyltransferase TrmD [Clostridia bacterium]|nr:tRNA (guanosine(37)-N1)-methyltransferase TrmD [Clostridia bacterium]